MLPAKGSGEGAQRGAAFGAAVPIVLTLHIPTALPVGIVLSPVGAVFGAMSGATEALPAEKVEKAEAVLKVALSPQRIETVMADAMRNYMLREANIPVVFVKGREGTVNSDGALFDARTRRRVDTFLELKVSMLGLIGPWTVNPPLSFTMRIATRLVRAADQTEIHTQELTYIGPAKVFTAWAANNAEAFRKAA